MGIGNKPFVAEYEDPSSSLFRSLADLVNKQLKLIYSENSVLARYFKGSTVQAFRYAADVLLLTDHKHEDELMLDGSFRLEPCSWWWEIFPQTVCLHFCANRVCLWHRCSEGDVDPDGVVAYYESEFELPAPQEASLNEAIQSLEPLTGSLQVQRGRLMLNPTNALTVRSVSSGGLSRHSYPTMFCSNLDQIG
ncbi:hypothetical protein XENOCAPTIV_003831 [Xenoophorus captivus]|uniref:SEA domain-containing protein n=1 Tax=Xenoophorus captivus TaxID=1517983 RepID=A0ABV0RNK2_9TELE